MRVKVEPLDVQIQRILRKRILSGEILPGENLHEVRLAEALGASRTPLRQAMIRLAQEGFLVAKPNRGFFVAELSGEEAEELYPILASLEGLALRQQPPGEAELAELEHLNEVLSGVEPEKYEEAVDANFRWHEALIGQCRNGRLLSMIETLRHQVYRYEISFFSPGLERLNKSVQLHQSILDALARGEVELACARLDEHWQADLDALVPVFEFADVATHDVRAHQP